MRVVRTTSQSRRLSGMRGFTVVWFGQLISFLGTGMTQFALTIWAWEKTGEATASGDAPEQKLDPP